MRKISFLDIVLNNNIKSYMKGDWAYMCNLQPSVTFFPGSYLIMRFALCRDISLNSMNPNVNLFASWHVGFSQTFSMFSEQNPKKSQLLVTMI